LPIGCKPGGALPSTPSTNKSGRTSLVLRFISSMTNVFRLHFVLSEQRRSSHLEENVTVFANRSSGFRQGH
jgi:hypothetical protein